MSKKEKTETKVSKLSTIKRNVVEAVVGVANLADVSSSGVAAYVLWFSTDSLTLHGVSVVLVVFTAVRALKLSMK